MKKPMLVVGLLLSFGGCLLWGMCGMEPKGAASPAGGKAMGDGYWNSSCVTGDGRFFAAGGDHAVLVDLATGKIVERVPGMVKALGCEQSAAVVVGYETAWRLPGKSAVAPVPNVPGDVVAMTGDGAWVSWTRTISGRAWRGPATLFVTAQGESRRMDLVPALFGKIGEARAVPTADSFAVRVGKLLDDGRLLVAAGWQPSQSGGTVEELPWGFFAVDLRIGEAAALTLPLASDGQLNQNWVQQIAANADASFMAVAAHDGKHLAIGAYAQGADKATRVTSLPSAGAASALAVSENGSLIAIGSESRGKDDPATVWVIDQAGKPIWTSKFAKTVVGLQFLEDGALLVTSAAATAMRVELPEAKETWRMP